MIEFNCTTMYKFMLLNCPLSTFRTCLWQARQVKRGLQRWGEASDDSPSPFPPRQALFTLYETLSDFAAKSLISILISHMYTTHRCSDVTSEKRGKGGSRREEGEVKRSGKLSQKLAALRPFQHSVRPTGNLFKG